MINRRTIAITRRCARGLSRRYEGTDSAVVGIVDLPSPNAGRSAAGLGDVQQTHRRAGWGSPED